MSTRLQLKQPTGWSPPAEFAQALTLPSMAPSQAYVHLCLNANRRTRASVPRSMIWHEC